MGTDRGSSSSVGSMERPCNRETARRGGDASVTSVPGAAWKAAGAARSGSKLCAPNAEAARGRKISFDASNKCIQGFAVRGYTRCCDLLQTVQSYANIRD